VKRIESLIIVLGSPNSDAGELSSIAISRLDRAAEIQQKNANSKILLTGGFGEHFNRTKTPHAEYARQYLLKKIEKDCILKSTALSANTIEDAIKSKPIVDLYNPIKLTVVSSEFHIARVCFIFDCVFYPKEITYLASTNRLPPAELQKVTQHEESQLEKLKRLSTAELKETLNELAG